MPALVRRAARRAGAFLGCALMFLIVVLIKGRTLPLQGLVHAATGAAGLLVLAVVARPVSRSAAVVWLQHVALGVLGPGLAVFIYLQVDYVEALSSTGDPVASWSTAARSAAAALRRPGGDPVIVAALAVGVGAALATLLFSGARSACSLALLLPLPSAALLLVLTDGALAMFAVGAVVASVLWTMVFSMAEPSPRLLSGDGRSPAP